MKKEPELKEFTSAIARARKFARIEKVVWIVCAAIQAAFGTYDLITSGWKSSVLFILIALLYILVAAKVNQHEEDLRMLNDTIEKTGQICKKATEYVEVVHKALQDAIAEAETEAQKEQED